MGITAVYYKCKERSARIYRLARNRGKNNGDTWVQCMPVYTGDRDDVYMEEENSTQHEEDSLVLTDVKQRQDHELDTKSAFFVLRQAPPVTTQV